MTESGPSSPRRIDLAQTPPFDLGALRVCPNALEVHGPDGVSTLEPRVMQVLAALHQSLGEPVSREDFSGLCWDGRIVGEDALFRCIGRLRKTLAAEPRAVIDTIPKVGYRLRVTPAQAADAPPPEAPRAHPARRTPRAAALVAAGVGAAAIGAFGLMASERLRPAAAWSAEGMRPLTAEPGMEIHPALSPDGRFLVYAAAAGAYSQRDLFLRGVNEGAPLRLTRDPANDFAPAWSPSGDRIAFVRQSGGQPCRIVVLPIPSGAERTVGRCSLERFTRVAWLDERTILLSDRTRPDQVKRIRALDIETGAARDFSRPDADSMGDSEPLPSPDGRSVVFRRSAAMGVDHLYLADARTGAERPLKRDGWKAMGYAWAPDGRTLFYATNRGGDFGLWSLDTRRPSEPKRISLGLMTFGSMSSDRSGRLAVETLDRQKNLFALDAAGTLTALTASTARDWDPDVSVRGGVAYVSDQNGAPEVWVRPEGGEPAQATRLRSSFLFTPRWSPDGRRVAFVAARDQQTQVWAMNADGSGLVRVTSDDAAKTDPAWAPDGASLVYAEQRGPVWRLMRVPATGGQPVPVPGGAGFRQLRAGPDGRLYGVKAGDDRLWRLPAAGGAPALVSPDLLVDGHAAWAPGPRGVYVLRSGPSPTLWLHAWSGETTKLADLPSVAAGPSVGVDPRTGAVIFPRKLRDESDIALLDLRSKA